MTMDNNQQLSPSGLVILRALNEAVRSLNCPLEGNLFYFHQAQLPNDNLPDAARHDKRANFLLALKDAASLLEVGFNAGHSALLALDNNPSLRYHGIDIGLHPYTRVCASILEVAFGDRFQLEFRDSRQRLPAMLAEGAAGDFDVIHVDGGHDAEKFEQDIHLALALVKPGGLLVVDDTNYPPLAQFAASLVARGVCQQETFSNTWLGGDNIALRASGPARIASPPKRMLIQFAVGEPHESLLRLTQDHHAAFCARFGIDYNYRDKTRLTDKRPHWRKVQLIAEALVAGYETVMWMDADAVIMTPKIDIMSFAGPDLSVCECFDSPTVERHYNTGVLFLRNTETVRRFVSMWDATPDTFTGWADQQGFIDLVKQNKEFRNALTILPNAFNCVPVHMEADNPFIASAHGEGDRRCDLVRQYIERLNDLN